MKIDVFSGKYEFLSNFYPCKIIIDGIHYPSVEHAFQAMKTHDEKERLAIAKAISPGKAKRIGRSVTLREDWEKIKDEVMYNCVKQKFSDQLLKDQLLATEDSYLEEGTLWHDNYWGNCICPKCKGVKGENHLGKILMRVREEFAESKKSETVKTNIGEIPLRDYQEIVAVQNGFDSYEDLISQGFKI